MFNRKIAVDLGTAFTRIQLPRKGIVLEEPTVIASRENDPKSTAVGRQALEMVERTPGTLTAVRPVTNGVIADFRQTRLMLEQFMNQSLGGFRLQKPTAMLTVSAGATSTERRAVIDVAKSAGIQNPHLIHAPVAAALGAGVPIAEPSGNLVVHIGGGTTEVAVVSLSGVVAQQSIRIGGQTIDAAIARYLRLQHNLHIGTQTAEEVKHIIAVAMPSERDEVTHVQGRDTVTGMPKTVEITSNEIVQPIEEILEKIMLTIRSVMERTSPELVADIIDHGLVLTGGGAQLNRLDDLMRKVVGVPALVARDPGLCAIKGATIALENLDDFKKSLFNE